MKIDALPSAGLIPNGPRVRQELVKAISFCEVLSDAHVAAAPSVTKNSSFDTDTDWTKGAGVTIANGAAVAVGVAANAAILTQTAVGVDVGTILEFELVISAYTAGDFRITAGGTGTTVYSTVGVHRGTVSMGAGGTDLVLQNFGGPNAGATFGALRLIRSSTRAVEQAKTLDAFLSSAKTALSGLIDSAAPTFGSAVIPAGGAKLELTLSELLDASVVPAVGQFVSSPAKTFSSVTVSGNKVTLVPTVAFAAGATTIAYNQPAVNSLRDGSGNLVATFAAQSVTNNA